MASPRRPSDTIVAIATAPGRAGIGVVRLSGPNLEPLAAKLTGRHLTARVATLSYFRAIDGSTIDQGIAVLYVAPRSFTGEDVLELQGHGGPVVMQMLLERCLELGARVAEPGEFTRRAFLNDKLDLAQAESVADLIEASTAQAVRSAVRSLSGEFSRRVHELEAHLIEVRMLVEATLDFPDEEIDFLEKADAFKRLADVRAALMRVLDQAQQGSLLRSGLRVVIAGAPNVGKSSLLNRLAGEERAIVTDIAGTTRDALRETIQVGGVPLHIVDTAGLRETGDAVERIGIERTWQEIGKADVVLHLVEARQGWTAADDSIDLRLPAEIEHIVVENKIDVLGQTPFRREQGGRVHLGVSALAGTGIDLLQQELLRVGGLHESAEDVFLARERHLLALRAALARIESAQGQISRLELFAEELRLAQSELARITGEFTPDDLLGEIFSRFCVGK